jgi:manganese transport protein
MPHNLYLHSSAVQTRRYLEEQTGKKRAIRYATADVTFALFFAFLVNAAILVTAAAVFHARGHSEVTEVQDAFRMLSPLLGTSMSSLLFAVALLASGQSSAVTATLAGQIVMEGYTSFQMPAWARRLLTRLLAMVPALVTVMVFGSAGVTQLLIASQIILALQLPFAVAPLIGFTCDKKRMGDLANPRWLTWTAYLILALIVGLNAQLILIWIRL